MPCITCVRPSVDGAGLCRGCLAGLVGAPEVVSGGVVVSAAFAHRGTARRLVHLLKYSALPAAAGPLAIAMAPRVGAASAIVPVPRARLRTWRYGIDPALQLAVGMARITGLPVVPALAPGWWHARRAGSGSVTRGTPAFRQVRVVPVGAILVDDVVTTGTTLTAASRALGHRLPAVVATLAPTFGETRERNRRRSVE